MVPRKLCSVRARPSVWIQSRPVGKSGALTRGVSGIGWGMVARG